MPEFLFIADQLWLDFVNTQIAPAESPTELLKSPADLLAWLKAAGTSKSAGQRRLQKAHGPSGELWLKQALEFRGALRSLAAALSSDAAVPDRAVKAINQVLLESRSTQFLRKSPSGFELAEDGESSSLLGLLAPVARSAAEFLVSGKFDRVRKCGNPACILYIYDTTRSHTRQWCSMETCGNRMKVAAFYRRQHPHK
ncbi:MAG: CGNR zinc finger domain-containing protein [Acidobacteriaceae bacterium]